MILESYSEFRANRLHLNEAFSEKDMVRAVSLIVNYLEKQGLGKMFKFPLPEYVQQEGSSEWKLCQRYFFGTGKAIRFNWSKEWGSEIESVDVWDGSSSEPVVHVNTQGQSIVKILPGIATIAKNPNINPTVWGDEDELDSDYAVLPEDGEGVLESELVPLNEAISPEEMKRRAAAMKIINRMSGPEKKAAIRKENELRAKVRDQVKKERMKMVERNVREKREVHPKLEKQYAEAERMYSDPKTVFSDLNSLVRLVANRIRPSLLVTGMAGIGKTYDVTKALKDELGPQGINWIHVKGKATPMGLYSTLYFNRDKIVVFDDCDSIFGNSDAVNILKSALDSYDVRTISWISPKMTFDPSQVDGNEADEMVRKGILPNSFDFEGGCIFISNIPMNKMDPAVASRSFTVDINLRMEDVVVRLEAIMPAMNLGISMPERKKILSFLVDSIKANKIKKELSIRTFINAVSIYQSGVSDWERMVGIYA